MHLSAAILLVGVAARASALQPARALSTPTAAAESCSKELVAQYEPSDWDAAASIGTTLVSILLDHPMTAAPTGTCQSLPEVTGSQGRELTEAWSSLASMFVNKGGKKMMSKCPDLLSEYIPQVDCLDSMLARATAASTGGSKSSANRPIAAAGLAMALATCVLAAIGQ